MSEDTIIVVGAGLSGLATALEAARRGRTVTVFEAADRVGGAAAYSGGQVWVGGNHVAAREGYEDDLEATETYVRAIGHDHPELLDEDAMRRWLTTAPEAAEHWEDIGAITWQVIPGLTDYHSDADGAFGVGRYITTVPFEGSDLGAWRERLNVSPHFPVGKTYEEIAAVGRRQAEMDLAKGVEGDPLTFGTGLVASFLARTVQEEGVEILVGHRVVELLADDAGVIGAVAEGPDGARVERRGPVVLATSSYDRDPELVAEFLDIAEENFGSVAPRSLRGDGIRLARAVGGTTARIPATNVPMLPGWESDNEPGYTYGPEYALPGAIMVDGTGSRFCDDSYYIDIIRKAVAAGSPHLPCFMVWDDEHRERYGLGETLPGGEYPPGQVTSAATLEELGAALGIDGDGLARAVERFNEHAVRGEDPEFGRGTVPFVRSYAGDPSHELNPLVGPLDRGPYHGMRLVIVGTGIGSSGVRIDGDGHVLDDSSAALRGLYAVGSCAALTSSGSGYNSGFALGRGLTLAYLVARELAGDPVPREHAAARS